MLVAGLQGVDDAEHLGRVAAGGGRVGEDGADLLVGVDDEDAADGKGNALLVDVGSVLVVDPVCAFVVSSWFFWAVAVLGTVDGGSGSG